MALEMVGVGSVDIRMKLKAQHAHAPSTLSPNVVDHSGLARQRHPARDPLPHGNAYLLDVGRLHPTDVFCVDNITLYNEKGGGFGAHKLLRLVDDVQEYPV